MGYFLLVNNRHHCKTFVGRKRFFPLGKESSLEAKDGGQRASEKS
jgi:hypothetical protein